MAIVVWILGQKGLESSYRCEGPAYVEDSSEARENDGLTQGEWIEKMSQGQNPGNSNMVARERWEAKRLEVMESDRKLTEFSREA